MKEGLVCKPINDDDLLYEGFMTQYVEWPWWARLLLNFKRAKLVKDHPKSPRYSGERPLEFKFKLLFGIIYLIGIRFSDEKP